MRGTISKVPHLLFLHFQCYDKNAVFLSDWLNYSFHLYCCDFHTE
nr:MAG TPA: hypothetical protein [Caudoviricetes sp.]